MKGEPTEVSRQPDPSLSILDRYLAGHASGEERNALGQWSATSPEGRAELEALRLVLTTPAHKERAAEEVGARVEAILVRARTHQVRHASGAANGSRGLKLYRLSRLAIGSAHRQNMRKAIVTMATAVTILCCWVMVRSSNSPVSSPSSDGVMRTIVTADGQQSMVTLVDGTKILLNAGSRLRIPRDPAGARTLELQGEALFIVTHRSAQPFVVQTGNARVTVLGTTFVLRHYPEERRARVVVVNGRVSMESTQTPSTHAAVLDARGFGEVADSGHLVTVTPDVDVNQYIGWTQGQLVFRATPLRDVLPELQRRYGLVIHLADTTLADQHLTATLADDSPDIILDFVAKAFGMRYTRDGNTVTLFRSLPSGSRRRESLTRPSEVSYGK